MQYERNHADAPGVDSDDEGVLELSNDSLAHDRQLLKELHCSESNEHEQNLRCPTEQRGKIVNYGDVVQLLHVHSGRYIQLLEKIASLDKDCLALAIREGSNSCNAPAGRCLRGEPLGRTPVERDARGFVPTRGGDDATSSR